MKKLRIGFVGCGQFCANFVPIFRNHPDVEYVAVCDKFRERAEKFKEEYNADKIFYTFDEMIASDEINSVAIFTQRDLHGVMAIAALKAGKHVYSAVPMALKVEEILEIVRIVKETGLTYSMGETGVYRPASIFCRQKNANGEFGDMVYGALLFPISNGSLLLLNYLTGVFLFKEKLSKIQITGMVIGFISIIMIGCF